jgi:hypothetical protein
MPQPASPSDSAPVQITETRMEIGETDIAGVPLPFDQDITQWRTAPKAHGWDEYKRLDSALPVVSISDQLYCFKSYIKTYNPRLTRNRSCHDSSKCRIVA